MSSLALGRCDQRIRFGHDVLAVTERWGIAHWQGSYTLAEHDRCESPDERALGEHLASVCGT